MGRAREVNITALSRRAKRFFPSESNNVGSYIAVKLSIELVFLIYSSNHLIMGNSGDVSEGRCGGGAPYCGPRGALYE